MNRYITKDVFDYYPMSFLCKYFKNIDKRMEFMSMLMSKLIKCLYVHPVNFKLVYQTINFGYFDDYIDDFFYDFDLGMTEKELDDFKDKLLRELKQELENNQNWDWVVFPEYTELEGFGTENGNTDNRGGGCGHLSIPISEFYYKMHTPYGITVRHLTEICYRMKGSKYDTWYELFEQIKRKHNKNKKLLSVRISFGYGS